MVLKSESYFLKLVSICYPAIYLICAFNCNQPFNHLRRNINTRFIHYSYDDKVLGYLSAKHWVLKVGDLRGSLHWFEKKFNFTVVCCRVGTYFMLHLLYDFNQLPPFPYIL